MKRFGSILLALLFLVSGMQLTLATHFCKGNAVALQVSFSGMKASCGMESEAAEVPATGNLIKNNCCYDDLQVYKTDRYYAYAESGFKVSSHNMLLAVSSPGNPLTRKVSEQPDFTDPSPPGYFSINSVNSAKICIFRL